LTESGGGDSVTDHGWERWTEQVDWTDWRSWLRKVASTDWASAPWPSAPWEQAAAAEGISLTLRAVEEDELDRHVTATWPAIRHWWRDAGHSGPPPRKPAARRTCPNSSRLGRLASTGRGPRGGRHARLGNRPPFLTGCSQAAVLPGGPALIRNCDCITGCSTRWWPGHASRGPRVCSMHVGPGIGSTTLASPFARLRWPPVGEGFGIPLVVRCAGTVVHRRGDANARQ
jgi:hypothetical protein